MVRHGYRQSRLQEGAEQQRQSKLLKRVGNLWGGRVSVVWFPMSMTKLISTPENTDPLSKTSAQSVEAGETQTGGGHLHSDARIGETGGHRPLCSGTGSTILCDLPYVDPDVQMSRREQLTNHSGFQMCGIFFVCLQIYSGQSGIPLSLQVHKVLGPPRPVLPWVMRALSYEVLAPSMV